jgi:hypothetical protein
MDRGATDIERQAETMRAAKDCLYYELSVTYMMKATIKQTKPALFGKSMWKEHYLPAKTYWEMDTYSCNSAYESASLLTLHLTAKTIIPN